MSRPVILFSNICLYLSLSTGSLGLPSHSLAASRTSSPRLRCRPASFCAQMSAPSHAPLGGDTDSGDATAHDVDELEHKDTYFKEEAHVLALLQEDTFVSSTAPAQEVCDILQKYQEFGELIEPYLESFIDRIFLLASKRVRDLGLAIIERRASNNNNNSDSTSAVDALASSDNSSNSTLDMLSANNTLVSATATDAAAAEAAASAAAATAAATASLSADLVAFRGLPVSAPICVAHRAFSVLYTLCKVRGADTVGRFVPHHVRDLEPALAFLSAQSPYDYASWHLRYGLLLWLSTLALIPFDLRTLDSTATAAAAAAASAAAAAAAAGTTVTASSTATTTTVVTLSYAGAVVDGLLVLAKLYLADSGPVRDAAAYLVSKLFSRADMHHSVLAAFCDWAKGVLSQDATAAAAQGHRALVTGVLQALVLIVKVAPRASVQTVVAPRLWTTLFTNNNTSSSDSDTSVTGDSSSNDAAAADTESESSNSSASTSLSAVESLLSDARAAAKRPSPVFWVQSQLCRKLWVKLVQRIGLAFLTPKVAKWRYQRGHRSLTDNLALFNTNNAGAGAMPAGSASDVAKSATAATATAPGTGDVDADAEFDEDESESVEAEYSPEYSYTEVILDRLLVSLNDDSTAVRWSAAKGIGRITNNLPRRFADQLIAHLLAQLTEQQRNNDALWHGSLLALAELARRGLLLPRRLVATVPLVLHGLLFDVRRGNHSVGTHVRDAACYVAWAFARAYTPETMRPYVNGLATGLITTALYDRDVNCRRAAAAAFQEHVGRQVRKNK